MSAYQSHRDGHQVETHSLHDELGIDPEYEIVPSIDPTGHLGKLVDPFINMQYPLNRDSDIPEGVIHHPAGRWQAVQRPDGSGIVRSKPGGDVYGLRLADGTVLGNRASQLWFPYKSQYHKRRPDNSGEVDVYDYDWLIRFPFDFVRIIVNEFVDIDGNDPPSILEMGSDIETFMQTNEFMRDIVGADILDDPDERGVLLTHRSGIQVFVGWDSTSHNNFELFGFVPFDGTNGVPAPSASDALDLLTPNTAAASPDSCVERQGEWFLVPTGEDADGTIQKPGVSEKQWRYTAPRIDRYETRHDAIGAAVTEYHTLHEAVIAEKTYPAGSPLDNHLPRDWRTVVSDDTFVRRFAHYIGDATPIDDDWSPQDVVDYVYEHEDEFDDDVYADIREIAGGVQVRGTLRHRDTEHRMVSAGDEWREATTHEWDVMTQDGQRFHLE